MAKGIRRPPNVKRPVVWVTGASRGIGREIAKQFSSIGCIVALSSRSRPELHSLENEIRSLGGQAKAYVSDMTDGRSVLSCAATIVHDFGHVDVLVNNAGVTSFKSFRRTSIQEFDKVVSSNLRGSVLAIQAVYPMMVKRKGGWIMNIISTAALKPFTDSSAYSAAKAGLRALANVLREESRQYNIRIINIYPGPTKTEMWSSQDRKKYGFRMMSAKSVGEAVLALYQMPPDVVVEDLVLRPLKGDIDK